MNTKNAEDPQVAGLLREQSQLRREVKHLEEDLAARDERISLLEAELEAREAELEAREAEGKAAAATLEIPQQAMLQRLETLGECHHVFSLLLVAARRRESQPITEAKLAALVEATKPGG